MSEPLPYWPSTHGRAIHRKTLVGLNRETQHKQGRTIAKISGLYLSDGRNKSRMSANYYHVHAAVTRL